MFTNLKTIFPRPPKNHSESGHMSLKSRRSHPIVLFLKEQVSIVKPRTSRIPVTMFHYEGSEINIECLKLNQGMYILNNKKIGTCLKRAIHELRY